MGILSSLACLPWLDGHWNLIRMRARVNDCAESVAGELSWTGPVILGNDRLAQWAPCPALSTVSLILVVLYGLFFLSFTVTRYRSLVSYNR